MDFHMVGCISRKLANASVAITALLALATSLFANPVVAFQLQSLQAERVNLNDFVGDGQWTLVMFWSTDCIPCEQQKPMIESFHRDHAEKQDAAVVGIALDGIEQLDEIEVLIKRHDPSYPNLVVFTDVFHRQFKELTGKDFRATPTYLLYAPDGSLAGARTGQIDRETIEAIVSR